MRPVKITHAAKAEALDVVASPLSCMIPNPDAMLTSLVTISALAIDQEVTIGASFMQPIIWRILVAVFVGSAVGAGQGLSEVEENRCGEQHEGTGCWQELANRPGCYLWNDAFNKSVSPS